ncbi:MAG: hypothetical protein IJ045_01085, partial [Ruminiclostridium sp.]|nr:hypothetical protein [Ruminiclostridium sp.]
MFKKITAFITAAALSIQCLCIGSLPTGVTTATASAEDLSSVYIDATANSDYIAGLDVTISDTSNKNSFVLNVSASPIGFEGYSPDDPIMVFYHKLVNTYLTEYLVDGEMPDPEELTQEELAEIMNKAKDAVTSDPELSSAPRFMTYTFNMPKKAAVTNEDDTEGTPADVYINCVSGKNIPYVGTNIRMGEYTIVDNGDSYKITISLDNYSLWANPDIFNFAVGMNINAADTDIEDVKLGNDGDMIEIDAYVVPPEPPADPNEIADNFRVEKSTSSANNDGTITYTIKAYAYNGATLAGKTITDLGPDNLSSMSLVSAKKDGSNVPMTGDALIYTFPEDSDETTSEITLTYKLKAGSIGNYIQNNGFYISTHNKVTLTDADVPEINKLADSWGSISHSFMNKQGQLDGSDNKTVNWTITIDTKYVCADNIYLVDYLNNTHTYVKDSLTINGVPSTLGADETIPDSLSALVVNPDGTVSVATDKVLTYGTGEDKTEGFVIKLSDFGNPADLTAGEKITIKYTTKLRDDIDADAYASENYGFMKYKNTSELIADNIYYGETDKPSATEYDGEIKREHELSTSVKAFEKSAGQFSAVTQTLPWTLTVNPRYGMSCDNAVITDVLEDGFAFADGGILTGKIIKDGGATSTITFTRVDGTAPSNDSVEEYKYYIDGNKITIGLGEVKEDEKYELILATKVVDTDFFNATNNWNGGKNVYNTASLHTLYNTSWTIQSASASAWLGMDNFRKEAISNYDVDNRTASWKITANISCLPIEGLKLTEVLPDGMKLLSVDKIEIRDTSCLDGWGNNSGNPLVTLTPAADATSCESVVSGDSISWTISDTPGAVYGGETVIFSFNGDNISDNKYEIYITTKATDEVAMEELGKGTDYYFENTCTLDGEIYDEPLSYTNTAKVNANYNRTDKKGEIVAGTGDTIMWTCTFNKDKVDMGEVWIIDDLSSVGLELILDNKLFELSIKSEGVKLTEEQFNKFEPQLNLTDFSIKIPEEYKDTTLEITFYTRIVEDAEFITNKLYIKQDGSEDKEEHSSSNAVDTSDYNFSAGASASPNPKIIINKTNYDGTAVLPGVKFKATYTYRGNQLTKSATSNANGIVYLTNLPKDVLITFTEESTIDGYVLYPKQYQVVFLDETTAADYENNVYCVDTNASTQPKLEVTVKNRPTGTPAVPEEIILFKNFENTDLSALSTTEANALLNNTEFTIYSDSECETELASSTLKWDSERKTAYVSFEELTDVETYYYIKETKAAAGFEMSEDVFKVHVDENGIVTYENEGKYISTYPVCENKEADIDDIVIKKTYKNTDLSALSENSRNAIIERTKFNLFTDAGCTQKVFENGISPVWDSENNTTTVTITSGIEFGKTYYLAETESPSIFKQSDKVIKVVVGNDGVITYYDGNTKLTGTPEIVNELKPIGPITLEKIYGDTELSTMAEADRNALLNSTVFTLYGNGELTMIIDTASPKWEGGKAVVSFTESLAPDYIYYLLETSAPDGYVKSEKLYKCVIDEDGNVSYFDGNTALGEIVCVNEKETPETTPAPETTTPAPETTTPAPETTTPAPETTTPAPETTTPAPETTTPAPETTTPAPETTTPAPETTTP